MQEEGARLSDDGNGEVGMESCSQIWFFLEPDAITDVDVISGIYTTIDGVGTGRMVYDTTHQMNHVKYSNCHRKGFEDG
jgi:hypothetical protein